MDQGRDFLFYFLNGRYYSILSNFQDPLKDSRALRRNGCFQDWREKIQNEAGALCAKCPEVFGE